MPAEIQQIITTTPYRATVKLTVPAAGYDSAENYSIARADGSFSRLSIDTVIVYGDTHVELLFDEAVVPGSRYTITFVPTAATGEFTGIAYDAIDDVLPDGTIDDPEADAFGIDIDILSPVLENGDIPLVTGRECLLMNLSDLCFTAPREIAHRLRDGVGIQRRVNASAAPSRVDEARALIRLAVLGDARIRAATVEDVTDGTKPGQTVLRINALPHALEGETLPVDVVT